MLSSAARISSTSQMLRSWVVFLGASTGTGLLMRMPHFTASSLVGKLSHLSQLLPCSS